MKIMKLEKITNFIYYSTAPSFGKEKAKIAYGY